MKYFFCPTLTEKSTTVDLPPEEAHHAAKVFRKRSGDSVYLLNGKGISARGTINEIKKANVQLAIEEITTHSQTTSQNIHIAIATIRPNRMDWAVEKLAELGVGSIQPIFTTHTSVKVFKGKHLQKIAISALKQSGNLYLPTLHEPLKFADWLSQVSAHSAQKLVAHKTEPTQTFSSIGLKKDLPIHIAVGPEGGFSAEELEMCFKNGFSAVTLSHAILRAETAAITATSQAILQL